MRSRSRIGAFVLILIGTIFLLINLGVLPIAEVRQLLAQIGRASCRERVYVLV